MQCACYAKGMCMGGSSFGQLLPLSNISLNDGQMLNNGHISFFWMQVQFWRAFLCTFIQFLAVLCLLSLCRIVGFVSNQEVSKKMEDIMDRPNDNSIDVFDKVKVPIYQKALAFNKYNKKKNKGGFGGKQKLC